MEEIGGYARRVRVCLKLFITQFETIRMQFVVYIILVLDCKYFYNRVDIDRNNEFTDKHSDLFKRKRKRRLMSIIRLFSTRYQMNSNKKCIKTGFSLRIKH